MGNIVPRILNYAILTFYYTRRFSIEEYGALAELYAYVAIVMVILTYGMETGLFKFSSEFKERGKVFVTAVVSVLSTSLFFLVVILMNAKGIATWMGYSSHPEYISYMAAILSTDAVGAIIFAKLRINNKVRKFATLKILNVLITIFFVMFFLEVMPKIRVISESEIYINSLQYIGIGYVLISNLIASISMILLLLPEFPVKWPKYDFVLLRNMLAYSAPLLISGLAGMLNENLDRILLKRIEGNGLNALHELGIFAANYRIAILMTLFIQMFRYAAEPFFFNQLKYENAKKIYADVLKYFSIFMVIIFLIVTLYLDIFKYFIDPSYFEGLKIVPIVLFANLIMGILFNVNMWYKLAGKTMYGVVITGIGALITIIFNIIFIPMYSYMACAWIHVASNFTMLALTYYFGQKFYKIHYDIRKIMIYIGSGIIIYGVFQLIKTRMMIANLIIATLLLTLYVYFCNKRENLIHIFAGTNDSKN